MSQQAGPKALAASARPADAERVKDDSVDAAGTGAGEHGLIELDRATSLELLAGLDVGRVAWADADRVMVFPLNFALDGEDILVCTPSREILAAVARHPVLTFQGDEFEPGVRTGWTVLVSGPAEEIVAPAEVERVMGLLSLWRDQHDEAPFRVLRIRAEQVSGRRLVQHPGAIESVYIA
jgi:uncharacterized protein